MTASQSITAIHLREILHYDPITGHFRWIKNYRSTRIGMIAGCVNPKTGYIHINIKGKNYAAHVLAWLYMTGEWPATWIDHKKPGWQFRRDNQWTNLRPTTPKQNNENHILYKNNSSGCSGVSFDADRNRWQVSITHNYKVIFLGRFKQIEDAISARKKAELLLYTHSQR